MSHAPDTWDTAQAAAAARRAFLYVARTYPRDAPLEPLGRADAVVLEAQEARDWPAYTEALKEMMRLARREALRRERREAV